MKLNYIIIPICIVVPFSCVFLPTPYNNFGLFLLFLSFFACIFIGWSSSIRNHGINAFNPFRQWKVATTTTLNTIEKNIVLYAIVIIASVFLSLIFGLIFI